MNADVILADGDSANYVSKVELDDSTLNNTLSAQLRVIGVSKDPDNSDLASANVNFVVTINEHSLKSETGNV